MVGSATPQSEEPVPFVVLRHTGGQGVHFDLMIACGERLATWQCPIPPEQAPALGLACTRIADHRRAYLDYTGPVSGDRGHVVRHDRGVCVVRVLPEGDWGVDFRGERLRGRYTLRCRAVKALKPPGDEMSERHEVGSVAGGSGPRQSWLLRAQ